MLNRARLSQEHAELDVLVGALLACTACAEPDLAAIARTRWEMSRRLAQHLAKEDRLLYPRMQASADRQVAGVAQRFAREMGGLAEVYRRYITHWSPDRIRGEWPAFRAQSAAIMDALRHRIAREEQELYPLIEGVAA